MLSRRFFVAGTLCPVIALSGVALAADGRGSASNTAAAITTPTSAVRSVEPDAAAAFTLLRSTPPTSPMPPDVVSAIASPTRFGRNAALARKIATPTGDGWVIPGKGFLCIAIPDPGYGWGTSCVPTSVAVTRGLGIGLTSVDGRSEETLLVPDGASAGAIVGGTSTMARAVTASTRWRKVAVNASGVATARTSAAGSLRVRR